MLPPRLLAADELEAWLKEHSPVRGGPIDLVAVNVCQEGDDLRGTFQLIVWELDEAGARSTIRDIKEQEIYIVPAPHRHEPARVRIFVEAWASFLPEVLERVGGGVDVLMPHDLVNFTPLGLARAETHDDFRRALRAKGRYGRFLAPAAEPGAAPDGDRPREGPG